MTCTSCGKPALQDPVSRKLCADCWSKQLEKRSRKVIIDGKGFTKHGRVDVIDDGTVNTAVALHVIRQVVKGLPYTLTVVQTPKDGSQIVRVVSADDLAFLYWDAVFRGQEAHLPDGFLLLSSWTQAEVNVYARLHGIVGPAHATSAQLAVLLDKLEERYPGIKTGLVHSAAFLDFVNGKYPS